MTHQPSNSQLFKATALALAVAGATLVVAVLPVEFGIDPTGLGSRLGLIRLRAPETAAPTATQEVAPLAVVEAPSAAPTVIRQSAPYRSEEMSLSLDPGQGAEIKALMSTGGAFVFSWTSSGPVNFDMHGERPNAGDEFTSYWMDRQQSSGHGSFTAPFDGSHGWYWRNRGERPVSVTVKVSGFFERLYRP